MIFLQFLFAHLVGDYLLQNSRIVKLKRRTISGLLLHTLLVLLAFAVVLLPYLHHQKVWIAIIVNFVLHTIQDRFKPKIEKFWPDSLFIPYLLDQLFHVVVLLLLAAWVTDARPLVDQTTLAGSLYTSTALWVYLVGVLLISYTADITLHIWKSGKESPVDYQRNYTSMAIRVAVFTLLFGLGLVLLNAG